MATFRKLPSGVGNGKLEFQTMEKKEALELSVRKRKRKLRLQRLKNVSITVKP